MALKTLETSASASAVSGHQFANEDMILTLQGGSCKRDVSPNLVPRALFPDFGGALGTRLCQAECVS